MPRVTEWVLGIVGGIAAFMGTFILLAGADQWVGIGGDLAWRVGDIAAGWGYALLIGGVVSLAIAVLVVLWERRHTHEYAHRSERTGLITHVVAFVLVNGFMWFQDIVTGDGLEYAYWATIPWGVGLAAHIIAYLYGGRHTTTLRPVA